MDTLFLAAISAAGAIIVVLAILCWLLWKDLKANDVKIKKAPENHLRGTKNKPTSNGRATKSKVGNYYET